MIMDCSLFLLIYFSGWVDDSTKPLFMKTKRQRAAQARADALAEQDEKEKDEEWKPRKPRKQYGNYNLNIHITRINDIVQSYPGLVNFNSMQIISLIR